MRPDLVLNLFQAFQKQWIKYTTLSVHDHMHGLLHVEMLSCIHGGSPVHHTRLQWKLPAQQSGYLLPSSHLDNHFHHSARDAIGRSGMRSLQWLHFWYAVRCFNMAAPITVWVFMISNSSGVSRPGLFRIFSSIPILPIS